MKNQRSKFKPFFKGLIFYIFCANIHHAAHAETSNDWVSSALGTYESEIFSGGSLVSGITSFHESDEGNLAGDYTMNEEDGVEFGTLSQCEAIALRIMRCTWEDKYGTGTLEMNFAEDFSHFEGNWGETDLKPEFKWNGAR